MSMGRNVLGALLAALLVVVSAVWVTPSALARCAPARGYRLERLDGTGAVARSGVVLFELVPVYERTVRPVPQALTLRPRRGAATTVALVPIASNLVSLRLPSALAAGSYRIAELQRAELVVSTSTVASPAITTAPALGSPGTIQVGTGTLLPSVALTTPPPVGAVGALARWAGSSYFVRTAAGATSLTLSRPRCTPDLPGYIAFAGVQEVEIAYVDADGRLSPSARVRVGG
jgi:hypothetical protein